VLKCCFVCVVAAEQCVGFWSTGTWSCISLLTVPASKFFWTLLLSSIRYLSLHALVARPIVSVHLKELYKCCLNKRKSPTRRRSSLISRLLIESTLLSIYFDSLTPVPMLYHLHRYSSKYLSMMCVFLYRFTTMLLICFRVSQFLVLCHSAWPSLTVQSDSTAWCFHTLHTNIGCRCWSTLASV